MTGQRTAPVLVWLLVVVAATRAEVVPEVDCPPPGTPGPLRPIVSASPQRPMVPARGEADPDLPTPSVSIRVRVPSEAPPGQELTYKILVENCSQTSAHHVTARVTIPSTAARYLRANPEPMETAPLLVWKLGTLPACAKREITLVVMPSGDAEVSCCARVQFEHGQCLRTRIRGGAIARGAAPTPPPGTFTPAPRTTTPPPPPPPPSEPKPVGQLQLRKTGPTEVVRYDILTYRLEVTNVGRGVARKVVLRDELPKGITFLNSKPVESSQSPLHWNIGDLAPGASQVVEYQVVAKEVGSIMNLATAEGQDLSRVESRHTLRIGQPALAVTKSGPRVRGVGRNTTYQITVSNPGDLPATSVQLTDDLPPDITFVSASDGGKQTGGQVRWNIGTLAPGSRRTVQLVVRSRRAGTFRNIATASADRGLTEQGKTETRFEEQTGLAVEIDPAQDPIEPSRIVDVVVRVRNAGQGNESNVNVSITLPDGLKLLSIPGVAGHLVQGAVITLPKRNLAAGGDSYVTLRLQAEKPGAQRLQVEVTSDKVTPDKAVRVEESITVLTSATTTSRKYSTW